MLNRIISGNSALTDVGFSQLLPRPRQASEENFPKALILRGLSVQIHILRVVFLLQMH